MLDKHLIAKTSPLARKENMFRWRAWRITVLETRLFRLERDENGAYTDGATLTVWYRDTAPVSYEVKEASNRLTITTERVTLSLGDTLSSSYIVMDDGARCPIENRENLLGTYRTLDECNGGRCIGWGLDEPVKLDHGVLARRGVAVLDDTATPILAEDGMPSARPTTETDMYVFAYDKDYRAALRGLYRITGTPPLIPRYALGVWWSRNHVYSDREYLHLLDRMQERDIPLTVATLDMAWHWTETVDERFGITATGKNNDFYGGANGWTGYSWNTELFPDYRGFLKNLRDRGLKVTMNLHPADGVRFFEDMYPEMAHAMGIDPATEEVVRFDMTDPAFINAYFRILHHPYEEDGIAFWWMDWQQGCQSKIQNLDPLWCVNHFHFLDNARFHTPLLLSRYCGIGSHRYPLGFSGDTYMTWETLRYLPYFTATASNAGYTWWSHDIGGFMAGINDHELYTRGVQLGVFLPITRLHCTINPCCTKEPSFYMNGTGHLAEEALRFRHRLIPYLYSASYATTYEGRALVEPMYYEHPNESNAYRYQNQYYFGSELLVVPVTSKRKKGGLSVTRAWLPEGHWTDIFTGDEYDGGRVLDMARWLDSIPVLLHEGGILPLDARRHTNDVSNPDALDVLVTNGNGTYTLREDDENGNAAATTFISHAEEGKQTLTICCSDTRGVTPPRRMTVQFRNIPTGEVSVKKNQEAIPFAWDDNGYLTVTCENVTSENLYEIEVIYTPRTALAFCHERYLYALSRIECPNPAKWDLVRYVEKEKTFAAYRDGMKMLPLSWAQRVRLSEQIPNA